MDYREWTTQNQLKFEKAFTRAVQDRTIVAIGDHSGTGFKHALKRFYFYNSEIRSAFIRVPFKSSTNDLAISMFKQLMTIRFNNFKYTKVTVFDLLRVLGQRVKQDLKGKKILIIFEDVHNLNERKLSLFMNLLNEINFSCGIVLRFDISFFDKVQKWNSRVQSDFLKITQLRQVTEKNRPQDIAILCQIYGLNTPSIVNQISKQTTSFTIAMEFIKRYNGYKPTSQLNLFSENRVRIA